MQRMREPRMRCVRSKRLVHANRANAPLPHLCRPNRTNASGKKQELISRQDFFVHFFG